jgi:hypothetical protein
MSTQWHLARVLPDRLLPSSRWSGLSREEKLAAAATTLEQFTAAWMDYLPAYLDWLTEEYGDMETASRRRL